MFSANSNQYGTVFETIPTTPTLLRVFSHYAHNFEKVVGAYCFGLVGVYVCVYLCMYVCASVTKKFSYSFEIS